MYNSYRLEDTVIRSCSSDLRVSNRDCKGACKGLSVVSNENNLMILMGTVESILVHLACVEWL